MAAAGSGIPNVDLPPNAMDTATMAEATKKATAGGGGGGGGGTSARGAVAAGLGLGDGEEEEDDDDVPRCWVCYGEDGQAADDELGANHPPARNARPPSADDGDDGDDGDDDEEDEDATTREEPFLALYALAVRSVHRVILGRKKEGGGGSGGRGGGRGGGDDGGGGDRLINPCACKGSVEWVHRSCLKKWLQASVESQGRVNVTALLVTFPLCAPEHLVLPGAQIVDLVSCLAIMSVWSRSKLRVCCEQPME